MTPEEVMLAAYTPDPNIGLFGGRWVPTGTGTVRWSQEREPSRLVDDPLMCRHCNEIYEKTHANQRYCSRDCTLAARRERGRFTTAAYRDRKAANDAA